jgi:hypothetical protein
VVELELDEVTAAEQLDNLIVHTTCVTGKHRHRLMCGLWAYLVRQRPSAQCLRSAVPTDADARAT